MALMLVTLEARSGLAEAVEVAAVAIGPRFPAPRPLVMIIPAAIMYGPGAAGSLEPPRLPVPDTHQRQATTQTARPVSVLDLESELKSTSARGSSGRGLFGRGRPVVDPDLKTGVRVMMRLRPQKGRKSGPDRKY